MLARTAIRARGAVARGVRGPDSASPDAVLPATPPAPGDPVAAAQPLEAQLLPAILDTVAALVLVVDRAGRILEFNRMCEEASGYGRDEVTGSVLLDLVIPPEQRAGVQSLVERIFAGESPLDHENDWTGRGRTRRIAWRNRLLVAEDGRELMIATGVDMTEVRRAEAGMAVVEVIGDLLATRGPTPDVLTRMLEELAARFDYRYLSIYLFDGEALQLGAQIGYTTPVPVFDGSRGVAGRTMRTRERQFVPDTSVDPDYVSADEHVKSEICIPLLERGEFLGILNIEADEPPLDEHDLTLIQAVADRLAGAIALGRKIRQLEDHAFHDSLTGLANRALYVDRLEHALARATRTGVGSGVLFLDLDDFKTVNDGLGHHAGDELLRQVAARLRGVVRDEDTVARLGGDEFAMLLEAIGDLPGARLCAERLIDAVARPFLVTGREMTITASVGVVVAEPDSGGRSANDLLQDADIAMYAAKAAGKGRVAVFEPPMRAAAVARLELDRDLRHAVDRDELFLVYQPIVDVRSGRVVAAEALARWRHPERGVLAPAAFMAAAEANGLIVTVGPRFLREACRQAAMWHAAGLAGLDVNVNLSPRQLMDRGLLGDVRRALDEAGLAPRRLTLEITEDVLMTDLAGAAAVLARLRELGVRVAIDDFGTGYSSLSYVRSLPIDVLKIDRAFISGLGDERNSRRDAVVETLFRLGRLLGVETVAEGIETTTELDAVRAVGADRAQGFLFARPMPPEELMALVVQQRALPIRVDPAA